MAICQSNVKDGDVNVTFLKTYDNRGKVFKISDECEKIILFKDIIKILPEPQIKKVGDRILYQFSSRINVLEK